MKKLLALLLTICLLLPSAALADAVTYRCEMQIGRDAYKALLTDMIQQQVGDSADQDEIIDLVTELICGILDVTALEWTVQDDGVQVKVLLQDAELFTLDVTVDEDSELAITTSLLEDTVLLLGLSDVVERINAVDWIALGGDVSDAAAEWYLMQDVTYDASGNYAGAAYEDGNDRIVVRVDDMDIALLVEGLLLALETNDQLPAITSFFNVESLENEFREIRAFNYDVALENAHEYELALVYHTEGFTSEPVGLSLNVLRNGEEAWSLSFGENDDAVRVIAAFHVDGSTNYFAFTQEREVVSSREGSVKTVFAVYQAAAGVSYAEASADPAKALVYSESVQHAVSTGTASHFRRTTTTEERSLANGVEQMALVSETVEEYAETPYAYDLSATVRMKDSDAEFASVQMSAKATEPFVQPMDNVQLVDVVGLMDNADLQEEMLTQLEKGVAAMGVTAMKNLPAELLMLILNMAR